jgi:hypothetical protein
MRQRASPSFISINIPPGRHRLAFEFFLIRRVELHRSTRDHCWSQRFPALRRRSTRHPTNADLLSDISRPGHPPVAPAPAWRNPHHMRPQPNVSDLLAAIVIAIRSRGEPTGSSSDPASHSPRSGGSVAPVSSSSTTSSREAYCPRLWLQHDAAVATARRRPLPSGSGAAVACLRQPPAPSSSTASSRSAFGSRL